MRSMLAFLLLILVTACAKDVAPSVPDPADLSVYDQRLEQLVKTEEQWRFPDSHTSLLNEHDRDELAKQQYAFIQAETREIGRSLTNHQRYQLLQRLRNTNDEGRMIVLARLAAAAGASRESIETSLPAGAGAIVFVIGHAIDEGTELSA